MILFILLLFIHPVTSENVTETSEKWDKFFFHTSISCDFDHKPNFTYDIMFYEFDSWEAGADDVMSEWFENEPILAKGITNQTYPAKMNGDGDRGLFYEPYAYIQHNCLPSEKPVKVSIYFWPHECRIGTGDCHFYVNIDLTGLEGHEKREVRIEQGETH